jgi:hypothetical protein
MTIKELYEEDKQKAVDRAEEKVKALAYNFALTLNDKFVFEDLRETILDLAVEIRTLKRVESEFIDIIDDLINKT